MWLSLLRYRMNMVIAGLHAAFPITDGPQTAFFPIYPLMGSPGDHVVSVLSKIKSSLFICKEMDHKYIVSHRVCNFPK